MSVDRRERHEPSHEAEGRFRDVDQWLAEYKRILTSCLEKREEIRKTSNKGEEREEQEERLRRSRQAQLSALALQAPSEAENAARMLSQLQEEYERWLQAVDGSSAELELNKAVLARVDELRDRYDNWRSWATAGALLGLLVAVVGYALWLAAALEDRANWYQILAGIGAMIAGLAAAALLTHRVVSGANERTRLVLSVAPLAIALLAVILIVARSPNDEVIRYSALLVAAGAATVLGSLAWQANPRRLRMLGPIPLIGFAQTGTSTRASLGGELMRLENDVRERAVLEGRRARRWRAAHLVIGGLAALSSGAAGVSAAQRWPGVVLLALGGAALTALSTALNPGKRWEDANLVAESCEALSREIEIMTRVDLADYAGRNLEREALEDVLTRFDRTIGLPEGNSFWRRNSARSQPNRS